jgi:DNA-binding CsgD family transcriptional regulator
MDAVDRIIDQLYDGATDEAAWAPALANLCDLVGAGHALGFVQDNTTESLPFVTSVRVDGAHLDRFVPFVPWGMSMLRAYRAQQTFNFDSVVPRKEFLRSDFFNDVIRPMNGYRALLAIPFRHASYDSYLALCRPERSEDYTPDEMATIDRMVPHVARAMRTKLQVDDSARRLAATLGAFDQFDLGIAIVNGDLKPVVLNRRAEQIIAGGDGLSLSRKGLVASRASDSSWLQRLVRHASADDVRVPGHYAMRLHRPAGSAWSVVARRLNNSMAGSGVLVALLIEESVRDAQDIVPRLMRAFDLSPREAALAAELANGHELTAAAHRLHIAVGTARNYLKAIFAKTRTHRQAELVALILRATRFGG